MRPDLPQQLQAGVIVYSYSKGKGIFDLQVTFDDLELNMATDNK